MVGQLKLAARNVDADQVVAGVDDGSGSGNTWATAQLQDVARRPKPAEQVSDPRFPRMRRAGSRVVGVLGRNGVVAVAYQCSDLMVGQISPRRHATIMSVQTLRW